MTDDLDTAAMQLRVQSGEPITALTVAAHGKIRRVAAAKRGVCQAPKMGPVEANLCDLGLHIVHKWQIARVRVTGPMSDKTGKLKWLKGRRRM